MKTITYITVMITMIIALLVFGHTCYRVLNVVETRGIHLNFNYKVTVEDGSTFDLAAGAGARIVVNEETK